MLLAASVAHAPTITVSNHIASSVADSTTCVYVGFLQRLRITDQPSSAAADRVDFNLRDLNSFRNMDAPHLELHQQTSSGVPTGSNAGARSSAARIVWTDLWVHLRVKAAAAAGAASESWRPVLVGATGYAEPGSIMAIMGPSGSGKTTLLDALAGRLAPTTVLTGDILLNCESKACLSYGVAGYVTQEDVLIGTLTVRESIMYSARLRVPDKVPEKERMKMVDRSIQEMGLTECQHTSVGNFFVRGLSGGEKRRLSIALQILTRPRLLFLDEPTSGLDSAAAFFVVQTLKKLAKTGRTVISSIHQPSSEVFALFDHLTLLSSGHTIYFGPAATASQFFAASGYPCPQLRNPSDHYLQLINADFDRVKTTLHGQLHEDTNDVESASADPLLMKNTEQVVKTLAAAYQRSEYATATKSKIDQLLSQHQRGKGTAGAGELEVPTGAADAETGNCEGHASFGRQCRTLTQRSFVNMMRDPGYHWLRVAMYLLVGFVLGTIFWRVGFSYNSIFARAGCMIFASGFLTFMAIGGFPSFVEDVKVFLHERLSGHYGVAAFVVGNTVASLPFLLLVAWSCGTVTYFMVQLHSGFAHYAFFILMLFAALACVESLMMAVASLVGRNFLAGIVIGAAIQMIYILIGGYFRLTKDLPKPVWRYPLSYIGFHTYAMLGLFKNEYSGLTFESFVGPDGHPVGAKVSGEEVLEKMYGIDARTRGKWSDLAILLAMVVAYRVLFVVFIKLNEALAPRFRRMASLTYCFSAARRHRPSAHPLLVEPAACFAGYNSHASS